MSVSARAALLLSLALLALCALRAPGAHASAAESMAGAAEKKQQMLQELRAGGVGLVRDPAGEMQRTRERWEAAMARVAAASASPTAGAAATAGAMVRLVMQRMLEDPSGSGRGGHWRKGDTVPRDLWQGPDLHALSNGRPLPSMGTADACLVLFLAGLATAQSNAAPGAEQGAVVELGPWQGQTSRCIVAGLAAGQKASDTGAAAQSTDFVAFDLFEGKGLQITLKRMTGWPEAEKERVRKEGFQRLWRMAVEDIYPAAESVRGDITKNAQPQRWNGLPINLLVIDSIKMHTHWSSQLQNIWPDVRPGTILALMDYTFTPQPLYTYLLRDYFEPIHISFCAEYWVFLVVDKPPFEQFAKLTPDHVPLAQRQAAYDVAHDDVLRLAAAQGVTNPEKINCVLKMLAYKLTQTATWL